MKALIISEIIYKFADGSTYIVRENGDSIIGEGAHKIMHMMNKYFNYEFTTVPRRVTFLNQYAIGKIIYEK